MHLAVGDVIVAIDESLLVNLQPQEVERRFGESYSDGALLTVGHHVEVTKLCTAQLEEAASRIIHSKRLEMPQSQPWSFCTFQNSHNDNQGRAAVHKEQQLPIDDCTVESCLNSSWDAMNDHRIAEKMPEDASGKQIPADTLELPVPGLKNVLLDAWVFTTYGSKAWQWCHDNGALDL